MSNIEVIWEEPRYNRFLRRLASFSRLILFDKRGVGASDRVSHPSTIEQRMEDVRGVMEAVGLRRAVLAGFSEGAPLAVQFAATYPQRVVALVLYGSCACGVRKPDYPDGRTPQENEQELARIRAHWGDESFVLPFVPSAADDQQLLRWFARMIRLSATPRDAEAMAIVGNEIDVRHMLPTVRVPTLVLHRTGDRACKVGEGRYVAEHIPNARFVELPGSDHSPFFGDQDAIVEEVRAFVAGLG